MHNAAELMPFHLAIPVDDLQKARRFYGEVMGCSEGRSDDHWVDFNFFGHQLVIHFKEKSESDSVKYNPVDNQNVPIPHFGVVLQWDVWHSLVDQLNSKGVEYIIEPYIRFKGQVGEQATMFFLDPCGNALEFKSFKNIENLFAK